MLTLGIETSCDETSCAVLKDRDQVLSNIISSSLFRHRPFGGVVPEIASRHSLEQIDTVYYEALKEAKVKPEDLNLITVTQGPGLIGSLLIGICFAKTLSYQMNLPLIGVNHLEAHLVANFIGKDGQKEKTPDSFVGLLVSGGHTSLTFHEGGQVYLMGETVDDAVGEAYDKVAKMMGLGYPGGPILDKLAYQGNPKALTFTKPKQKNKYDFSFSGIKTAVLYAIQDFVKKGGEEKRQDPTVQRDVAASFQHSVVNWLVDKTLEAAAEKKVTDVVVGGGVSANSFLRKVLMEQGEASGLRVWFPPMSLTIDNAAMIARRGVELFEKGHQSSIRLTGDPNLHVAV